jgi:hypothetical protein
MKVVLFSVGLECGSEGMQPVNRAREWLVRLAKKRGAICASNIGGSANSP